MPFHKELVKRKHQMLEYDDRMKARTAEYAAIGYTYSLSLVEKEALVFEQYKRRFKANYTYALSQVYRIKHRKEEYIIYRAEESVIDSNNIEHKFEGQRGWHTSPIAVQSGAKNEFGEPTGDFKLVGQKLVYEIPFDKELLKDLIAKSTQIPNCLVVGRGNDSPPDIISGHSLAVLNLQEFIEEDFEDLYEANTKGFLRYEYGGVKAYIQSRQAQSQDQAQAQANQFQQPNVSK